ncbi:hypothetical protein QHH11_15960 [Aphanizomenon sp. PH219]|nr:hypothetical protein [Aphanizomenon sp. 202]MDK2409975.1 hypothetical protein [Aphanizomenon sp. 202]MDK2460613.1 hypothetical protein [Aphanizomenon sp. PH219]
MTNCQKIDTDYGNLSISNRKGYYYATRTVNRRKRQIYLGKSIPDSFTLNEIAKDIFSNDKEYWTKHTKQIRASDKDTNNSLSLKDDLTRIAALAKARGEDLICQELRNLIKNLS